MVGQSYQKEVATQYGEVSVQTLCSRSGGARVECPVTHPSLDELCTKVVSDRATGNEPLNKKAA